MTVTNYYGRTSPPGAAQAELIEQEQLEVLGHTERGIAYARMPDGRELRVDREMSPASLDNPPASNEVRIQRVEYHPDPLSKRRPPTPEFIMTRATVVAPGTYDGIVAGERRAREQKAAATRRATTPHLIDVATLLPALDRQPLEAIGLGRTIDIAVAPLAKGNRMITTGGRDAVRGIAAIVGWLRAHRIELEVHAGALDVKATRIDAGVREILDLFAPMIVGHLSGDPIRCAVHRGIGRPPPAYSLAVPRTPACAPCLGIDE